MEGEIRRTREIWQEEKKRSDQEQALQDKEEARRRQREKEEWEYQFERGKRLANLAASLSESTRRKIQQEE